jgi:hypothetical protein
MARKRKSNISAQVVLKSASGKAPAEELITSDNVQEYLPSHATAESARQAFTAAGFEVGPMAGNSFSISAASEKFVDFFGSKVEPDKELELALGEIPTALRQKLIAVTFTRPPDFGPGGNFA